jgi:hypothetical protein
MVYYASDGNPAGIEALENRRTFVDFMDVLNNHLERMDLLEEQNKKNAKK